MVRRRRVVIWCGVTIVAAVGAVLWLSRGRGVEPPAAVDSGSFEPQVAEALQQARRAVLRDPGAVDLWARYAMLLDVHQQIPAAAVCYRVAEQLAPDDFRWPYLLAQCLKDEGPGLVIATLERARSLRPDYLAIHLQLGRLYLVETTCYRDLARERYRTALRLDPDSSHAMWGLARLAFDAGDLPASRSLLEQAARKAPDHREVCALLARVHARLGNDEAAAAARRQAEVRASRYPIPDPVRRQVHALALDSGRLLTRGQQALSLRRPDIAVDSLSRAAAALRVMRQRHPQDQGIRVRLAFALSLHAWLLATHPDSRVRDGPRGLSLAEELVRLAPDDPHSWRVLAAAQAEGGRCAAAKETLGRAMRLATSRGDGGFADQTRAQQRAYGDGRPWREPPR